MSYLPMQTNIPFLPKRHNMYWKARSLFRVSISTEVIKNVNVLFQLPKITHKSHVLMCPHAFYVFSCKKGFSAFCFYVRFGLLFALSIEICSPSSYVLVGLIFFQIQKFAPRVLFTLSLFNVLPLLLSSLSFSPSSFGILLQKYYCCL